MTHPNRPFWLLCLALGTALAPTSARAQVTFINSCSTTAAEVAVDLLDQAYFPLWNCDKVVSDDVWKRFSMETDAWHDFGYTDPCNVNLPMGRTFNALNVLNYAGTDSPDCNTDNDNWLVWGSCYASSSIHELTPKCEGANPQRAATTNWGTFETDPRTELHKPWFYSQPVPLRAADLVHEARHADGWCSHTDGCPAGAGACDPSFADGCVGFSSSSGKGAYAYTVMYDWWFGVQAQPRFTNTSISSLALDDARSRLMSNFESNPCFTIDTNGARMKTC